MPLPGVILHIMACIENCMRFDLITIFPEFFNGPLDHGIVRRTSEAGLIHVHVQNLREFTKGRHRTRSEEHTSELQSPYDLVCRLLLEKKKKNNTINTQ